jgi:hypothetical protein
MLPTYIPITILTTCTTQLAFPNFAVVPKLDKLENMKKSGDKGYLTGDIQ